MTGTGKEAVNFSADAGTTAASHMAALRLGVLEQKAKTIVKDAGSPRLSSWDWSFAVSLAIACVASYNFMAVVLHRFVSWRLDVISGLWAMGATIFVFRAAGLSSLMASVGCFLATCVSFVLCFLYLLVFPVTALGTGTLVGLCVIVLALINRREDLIFAGITTAVVLIIASLSPHNEWEQPLLRFVDTIVGIIFGIAFKWITLVAFVNISQKLQEKQ